MRERDFLATFKTDTIFLLIWECKQHKFKKNAASKQKKLEKIHHYIFETACFSCHTQTISSYHLLKECELQAHA
jgi:hypothetical protein